MPHDQLQCTPDPDGSFVITQAAEGATPPQVVARVYDATYARLMTKSPELLGTLHWVRTLLSQDVCQCQPGVRGCVVCITDDLLAELDQGTVP